MVRQVDTDVFIPAALRPTDRDDMDDTEAKAEKLHAWELDLEF